MRIESNSNSLPGIGEVPTTLEVTSEYVQKEFQKLLTELQQLLAKETYSPEDGARIQALVNQLAALAKQGDPTSGKYLTLNMLQGLKVVLDLLDAVGITPNSLISPETMEAAIKTLKQHRVIDSETKKETPVPEIIEMVVQIGDYATKNVEMMIAELAADKSNKLKKEIEKLNQALEANKAALESLKELAELRSSDSKTHDPKDKTAQKSLEEYIKELGIEAGTAQYIIDLKRPVLPILEDFRKLYPSPPYPESSAAVQYSIAKVKYDEYMNNATKLPTIVISKDSYETFKNYKDKLQEILDQLTAEPPKGAGMKLGEGNLADHAKTVLDDFTKLMEAAENFKAEMEKKQKEKYANWNDSYFTEEDKTAYDKIQDEIQQKKEELIKIGTIGIRPDLTPEEKAALIKKLTNEIKEKTGEAESFKANCIEKYTSNPSYWNKEDQQKYGELVGEAMYKWLIDGQDNIGGDTGKYADHLDTAIRAAETLNENQKTLLTTAKADHDNLFKLLTALESVLHKMRTTQASNIGR